MKRRKPPGPHDTCITPLKSLAGAALPITRRELVFLSIIVLSGIALRVDSLMHSAVEHFDEGVYASNLFCSAPDYAYPLQRFYAPPFLPALIEAGMIAGLAPNLAALMPSFLAGCGTIVALWWFGRSWFGPAAGLSAATLVALSDFHVLYSTAALTDALLGLWLVLAVDAIGRSIAGGDYRWAVVAGIYTGLAWWTKYNGWLPLAIEAAALSILWLLVRPTWQQLQRWLACFAITASVAGLVWSPYFFSLQGSGGYAPIAANHAKYVVGLGGWLDSASRQVSNQVAIESLLTAAALALAILLPSLYVPLRRDERAVTAIVAVFAGLGALVLNGFFVLWIFLAIGTWAAIAEAVRSSHTGTSNAPRIVGAALLLAWLVGLSVVTPLYSPYPRLLMPWLLAVFGVCAVGISAWIPEENSLLLVWLRTRRLRLSLLITLAAAGIALALVAPRVKLVRPEGDRQGVARAAEQILAGFDRSSRAIFVYGEPAMFFQLRAAGEELVAPVQTVPNALAVVEGQAARTYLVAGPHANRDRQFQAQIAAAPNWKVVERYAYRPSVLVWLDLHDARQPKAAGDAAEDEFVLYEWRP